MRLSRAALLVLAGVAILQLLHYYGVMPDTMASHFDGAGRPNGHQTRDGFFALSGGILAFIVVLFIGLGALFRVLPTKWFNLPHRDYWLAPERRDLTLDFMVRQMEWFGVASLGLLVVVLQGVFEANQNPRPTLDTPVVWWVLGSYFLYTVVWLVRFLRRFRTPQDLTATS